ncbi:hypothetical protein GUJ93_ZPchr0013g36094 [Zizania palustris]|uniref:Uncharacterized protein n=1 Tax=Zizania palustris TaxID=103762 RepID=A0A8J5X9Q2_ZIZPA|nr:hypothetical protein GUJ93_ZPchr0013g36094 [Zizania palustris]
MEIVPYKFTEMVGWIAIQLEAGKDSHVSDFSIEHLAAILVHAIHIAVITLPSHLWDHASDIFHYVGIDAIKVVHPHIAAAATIVDHLAELIKKKHHRDVRQDKNALHRLRVACEHAKKALSEKEETLVQIDSLLDGVDLSAPLTRAEFEELNHDLFDRAMGLVNNVVMGSDPRRQESRKDMVDDIIVVGGSSRIPKVRQLVKDYFHVRQPNYRKGVEPAEAVVHGAAVLSRPVVAQYPEEPLDFDQWFPRCYWLSHSERR